MCSECRQPWNSIWATTSIRNFLAPGNLVALGKNLFRELEQRDFWVVNKGGKGKCKCKLSLQSSGISGVSLTIHFQKGLLSLNCCCSLFLMFPYFHSSFSRLQSPVLLYLHHLFKLPAHFFSFFLELLLFHFTCSFFCCFWFWSLGFCLFSFCLFFLLLLLGHFKLVKKKQSHLLFCLSIFFSPGFSFFLFFCLLFQKIKLQ